MMTNSRLMCLIILFILMLFPMRASSQSPNSWNATIQVNGEQIGDAMYQDEAIIGIATSENILLKPPPPPLYTAYLQLWNPNWDGPYARYIRQNQEGKHFWIVDLNPSGNVPPPGARCAMLSWNPDEFSPTGVYDFIDGFDTNGTVLVGDMKTTTEWAVCDINTSRFFVINLCDCGIKGDMNCDDLVQPIDVTLLVNWVFRDRNDICNAPACPFETGDLDCSGGIAPLDVVLLVNYVYRGQPESSICDGCAP